MCNVHRAREDQVALIFGGKGSVVGKRVDVWRREPFIVEKGRGDSDEIKSAQWEV